MKRLACLTALVAAGLVPMASAHEGGPYLSTVRAITPVVPGLKMEVLERDEWLRLTNKTGKTVFVIGYDGERYLKITPGGPVEVNTKSPTGYADRSGQTPVPNGVSAKARPVWQQLSRFAVAEWRDRRIHAAAGTIPAVLNKSRGRKIHDWNIPLLVGNEPVRAVGTLYWAPAPVAGPAAAGSKKSFGRFIGIAVVLAMVVLAVVTAFVVRRRDDPETGEALR